MDTFPLSVAWPLAPVGNGTCPIHGIIMIDNLLFVHTTVHVDGHNRRIPLLLSCTLSPLFGVGRLSIGDLDDVPFLSLLPFGPSLAIYLLCSAVSHLRILNLCGVHSHTNY